MSKKKMIDYKGKYFTLQDEIYRDAFDFEIGEKDDAHITDEWLKSHVEICIHYGIPAYIGNDRALSERIIKLEQAYE